MARGFEIVISTHSISNPMPFSQGGGKEMTCCHGKREIELLGGPALPFLRGWCFYFNALF